MDMNVLSTYLARLQDKDYIEKVHADSADARIVRYQIPDKIYVVWYQKNYGAKDARYKWLVEFYKTAYSAEELEHGVGEPEAPEIVRESKLRALSELKAQVSQTMIVETVPEDKELSEWNAALDKGIEAYQKGKFNDALSEWTRAQKACEILVKKYPDNLMYQEKLAGSLNNLGLLMNDMGRFLESLNYKERALALFEALLTRDPTNARFQSSVAMALNNLGNLLSDLGRREESLKRYESALEMRETLLNSDPKNINYQSSVIGTTTNQVDLLTTIGRHRDAIRTLDAAIRIIPENHELLLLRSSANLALQNDGLARDDLRAALNLLESKGNGEFLTEIHPALLSYLRHGTPGFTIEAIKIVCAVFGTSLEDEKAKPLIPFKMAAEFLASDRSSGTLFNLDPLTRDATYKVLRDSGHEGDIEALNYKGKRKKRK